jgi:hypothetical protein
MLKLLERTIASVDHRLVLVAPPDISLPQGFTNASWDPAGHRRLVAEMQRLRGGIYLHDGAIQRDQLTHDGLHQTPEDARSWHLLMLNSRGEVSSCAWYMAHDETAGFDQLRVRNSPLATASGWSERVRGAIDSELQRARALGLGYAEVGGWAVARENRCTSEGLVLALAAYSLGRMLGGTLGLTTATVRHSSSTILRRLGGSLLELGGCLVPPYFDPKYGCEMELLRFDSRKPNPKYSGLIELLSSRLRNVRVIARDLPLGGRELVAPPVPLAIDGLVPAYTGAWNPALTTAAPFPAISVG